MKELTFREGMELLRKTCDKYNDCDKCCIGDLCDDFKQSLCCWDIDTICEVTEKLRGKQE